MNMRIFLPLLIFTACIVSSYSSAKKFFKPFSEEKSNIPSFTRGPRKPVFSPGRKAFGAPARLPIHAQKKATSTVQPTNDLEKGILLFFETEIAQISQQLSTAVGSKEMQEAASQNNKSKTTKHPHTFRRPSPYRPGPSGYRPGAGRPFGGRSPFSPRPQPYSSFSPFGAPAAFRKDHIKPAMGDKDKTPPAPQTPLKDGLKASDNKSSGTSQNTSPLYSAREDKKKKNDTNKEETKKETNIVRNVRRNLVKKMQELNQQALSLVSPKEQSQHAKAVASMVNGVKKELENLQAALAGLSNKKKVELQQHANKNVYATFAPHLFRAITTIMEEKDGNETLKLLLNELEDSLGKQALKDKAVSTVNQFKREQRKILGKKPSPSLEQAQSVEEKIKALQRSPLMEYITDTSELDAIISRARSVISRTQPSSR